MKNLITIGKIVKASGLKGRMKAISYMESPDLLEERQTVFIGLNEHNPIPYTIKGITVKGNSLLLTFEDITSIDASNSLKGQFMYLPRHCLPPLEEGEYYWSDIIGLDVIDGTGKKLGVITAVLPTGSNDVYVCEGDDGEILLPALEDVIMKIDVQKGIIVVELPEEL